MKLADKKHVTFVWTVTFEVGDKLDFVGFMNRFSKRSAAFANTFPGAKPLDGHVKCTSKPPKAVK